MSAGPLGHGQCSVTHRGPAGRPKKTSELVVPLGAAGVVWTFLGAAQATVEMDFRVAGRALRSLFESRFLQTYTGAGFHVFGHQCEPSVLQS